MAPTEMPLSEHLNDLRKKIIFCICSILILTGICYNFYADISNVFTSPFGSILNSGGSINVNTIYEGFFVKLKLSLLIGFILSLPIILIQVCRFILPGLKKSEKKWLFIIIFFSSLFSIGSTYLGYAIVFPYVITFLLNNDFIPSNINILLNYQQNVSYIVSFLFGSAIVFQSPILLAILLAKNIISRSFLWKNSRWFIVGIIICSAIVTPPDIFSQMALSLPLLICYFGCIFLAKLMRWGN